MTGTVRAALWLLLFGVCVPVLGAAEPLPRPAALEPAVAFWERIYTAVDSDEGLLHDNRDLDRVYARLPLPRDLPRAAMRARLQGALDRYREALRALAAQGGEPHSALQREVHALFPAATPADAFARAAARVRFQRGLSDRFAAGLRRSGRWLPHIREALERHGVPPELAALPHVESSFRPDARSHVGAAGMWQFTYGTGKRFMRIDAVVDERLDPWISSEAAAELLAANYSALGHWPLAITAYNHGANGMRRAVRATGSTDIAVIIAGYRGPYFRFASRNFYPALLAAANVEAAVDQHFPGVTRDAAISPVELRVADYMPLPTAVEHLGVSADHVRALNPGLSAAVWNGSKYLPKGYPLRLPAGTLESAYAQALAGVPMTARYPAQRPDLEHLVTRGESLSQIARRYGVGIGELAAANGLGNRHLIRIGQRLRLPGAGAEPPSLARIALDEGGAAYVVRAGDTLDAIARRHGISRQRLVAANDIPDPDRIRAGHRLVLPAERRAESAIAASEEG